jgi:hypothetical protein
VVEAENDLPQPSADHDEVLRTRVPLGLLLLPEEPVRFFQELGDFSLVHWRDSARSV